MATMVTTTVRITSCRSQRRTPAPASGSSSAIAWLTSRALAICRAEPGTIRMMKANSAASEP